MNLARTRRTRSTVAQIPPSLRALDHHFPRRRVRRRVSSLLEFSLCANDFCDKYQADGKINGMPTCVTSDNDGNPCCTQIGNQRCQYGYCLRSVG